MPSSAGSPPQKCPFCGSARLQSPDAIAGQVHTICGDCHRSWHAVISRGAAPRERRHHSSHAAAGHTHPVPSQAADRAAAGATAWVLAGESGRRVECRIVDGPAPGCSVIVTFGGDTLLTETHHTRAEATSRAEVLKARLTGHGWQSR